MAKTNNLKDFLVDLADGIRAKKGITGKIDPQDFRREIESIETGSNIVPEGDLEIYENGVYDVTNYARVIVRIGTTNFILSDGSVLVTSDGLTFNIKEN